MPKPVAADEVDALWKEHCHGHPKLASQTSEQIAEVMTAMRHHRQHEHTIGRRKGDRKAAEAVRRLLREVPPPRGQVLRDLQVIRHTCKAWLAPIEQSLSMPPDWLPPTGAEGFNVLARLRDLLMAADAATLPASVYQALRAVLPVLAPRTPAYAPPWESAGIAMWCMVDQLLRANGRKAAGVSETAQPVKFAAAATIRLGFEGVKPRALARALRKGTTPI